MHNTTSNEPGQPWSSKRSQIDLGSLSTLDGLAVATVHVDAQGRVFATKSLSASRHFLKKPLAIAMDVEVLRQAEALGVEYFRVFERDAKQHLWVFAKAFDKGLPVHRGFGPQLAVPVWLWQPGTEPPVIEIEPVRQELRQPTFSFEEAA